MSSLTSEQVRDAFKYMYPGELPALKDLVRMLSDNPTVINIGAGSGTSGLAILESRDDVTLVTIDVEDGDSPLGSLYSERDVMRRAGFYDLYADRWHQICADSKLVGRHWADQDDHLAIHFVFIDGDHSYAGCVGDIEAWLPHIVPGGIVAVHDYRKGALPPHPDGPHPKPWPGVDKAVDELLRDRYEMVLWVDSLIAFRI